MKTFVLLLSMFSVLVPALADSDSYRPSIVESDFHTGYLPNGFDTNDNVQIVGEGTYSNTCFRPAQYDVSIDNEAKKIIIKPKAYKYDGMCAMMLVPYSQEINLGILNAGRYQVIQEGAYSAELGKLNIRLATNSSADDLLYAPVSQAFWQSKDGHNRVTIKGAFTNSCWKLKTVRVDVQEDTKVVVIQPESEITENAACADVMVPFESTVEIDNMPKGRYLLHVRSTNAKAVNNLVDVL